MYYDLLQRDGEWSSGRLYICLWKDLHDHCLIIIKYPTGGGEEIRLHQLAQVFGEPVAILYKKCTGTIDIRKILEDCKDPDSD